MTTGPAWQVMLADLSLILFITTGVAISADPQALVVDRPATARQPAAIFIDNPDGPALSSWLRTQRPDPREQLTILASFAEGGRNAALGRASVLAEEAMAEGVVPRVVIEPADHPEIIAIFAYDRQAEMAQALQELEHQTAS